MKTEDTFMLYDVEIKRNILEIQSQRFGLRKMVKRKLKQHGQNCQQMKKRTSWAIIDSNYDFINDCIDNIFSGKKVDILRINKKQ